MKISHRQDEYMYGYAKGVAPDRLRMHMHSRYEFLYFKSGDASYIVENNIYQAEKGDIFITRPDELHTIAFHPNKTYEGHFMRVSRDFLSEFSLFDKIDSRPMGAYNRIIAAAAEKAGLYDYFKKVEYYVVHRLPESDAMIKSYFIQLLVAINSLPDGGAVSDSAPRGGRIDDIIDFLTENISPEITLDLLSEKFFINKYYMCHSFKEHTGLTIKEFMNAMKISKAKNMLTNGADIMNLCYDCGFNDYSTFYKTFKKLTGKSPKAFLQNR